MAELEVDVDTFLTKLRGEVEQTIMANPEVEGIANIEKRNREVQLWLETRKVLLAQKGRATQEKLFNAENDGYLSHWHYVQARNKCSGIFNDFIEQAERRYEQVVGATILE